jgi:hypothetical protein
MSLGVASTEDRAWTGTRTLADSRLLIRPTSEWPTQNLGVARVFLRIQRQEAQTISEYPLSSVSYIFITSDVIAVVSNRAHIRC